MTPISLLKNAPFHASTNRRSLLAEFELCFYKMICRRLPNKCKKLTKEKNSCYKMSKIVTVYILKKEYYDIPVNVEKDTKTFMFVIKLNKYCRSLNSIVACRLECHRWWWILYYCIVESVLHRIVFYSQLWREYLSYIHLGSSVCHPVCRPVIFLSFSCRPVIVAERWAILYVLVTKLTKETRRRVWRWRDFRWRDGKEKDRRGRVWKEFSWFKPKLSSM
jgi:hypothetical protein